MSEMVRELFMGNPAVIGPVIALVLFVTVFTIAAVRAMKAEHTELERIARLPLDEEAESCTEARHG